MRTAASSWDEEYSNTLEMVGFCPGRATVVAFYHAEREVRIVVHGDDFVVEGKQSDLEWVRDVLGAKYILQVRIILGPERVVDWRAGELWCVEWFQGKPSVVPGVKLQEEDGDEEELAGEDLTRYRSVVATANFISQDRPDVRFAVKELCREMARPTCASWRKLKKLARYLRGRRSSSMWMGW